MDKVGSFWKGTLASAAAVFCIHASQGEMPARYEQLDWLEADGAQWVLTGYVPKCTDRFEISLLLKNPSATQCMYCSRGSTSSALTMSGFVLNGKTMRFDRYSNGGSSFQAVTNVPYIVVADYATRECTVNGDLVYTMSNASVFNAGSPLTLFASHESGMGLDENSAMGNWAYYRFYSFRVYDAAGNLVREYLPALDLQAADARSACGVYETQNGTFHPNLGSRPFRDLGRNGPPVVLEKDEEWNAIALTHCGATIDLNGHNLRLGTFNIPATITNSSVTMSELHIDIADAVENSLVGITGNIKVVKKGAGAYSSMLDGQTFIGGLEIREGLVNSTANGTSLRMGAAGGEIHVGEGALLDMRGTIDHAANYKFFLEGGTITSSVTTASAWTKAMIADVRVGADSVIDTGSSVYGILNGGYALAPLDLGGHTLSIRSTGTFYIVNTTATAGTLILNGITEFYHGESSDFTAANVIVNGQLRLNSNCGVLKLGDCTFNTAAADTSANYTQGIQVYGTLRPNTDYFHGCEMQNGSTLDLRGRDAVFNTMGKNIGATAAMTTITFAAGAAVKIDLRGRQLAEGMCLMRWPAKPADTVTFSFDDETAAAGIAPFVADDGLYYGGSATSTYPAKATWTGEAGDGNFANPANWACVNAAGTAIAGATPAATTELSVSGDVAFNAPPDAGISYARIVFDGARLSADSDLRGLGALKMSGTLDLDGHTLRVAGLAGGGTITSSFDLTVPELERASTTTTLIRDTVPGNLFANNFEWAQDAVHRLICEHMALPCVVDYDFGESTLITAYKIHVGPFVDANWQDGRAPRDWQFLGSDDKESWTLLDERSNVVDWAGWECRTFTFANATAYRYYRIAISEAVNPSNGYMEFVQLEYGLAEKGFGTLQIDVPAGEEAENDGVAIDGNVRVEKTGGGLFTAKKAHQSYNMGTVVTAGSLRCGTADAAIGRGKVTVCADAVLDLGSDVNYKTGAYSMDLAGTVIATNAATQYVFGGIALSGDATIVGCDESFSFRSASVPPSLLALNGHTLTVEANGFVYLGVWHDDGTPGRLVLRGPEGTRFESSDALDLASYAVEVAGGAILKGWKDLDVGDFVYGGAAWQLNTAAFAFGVHGKFAPGEMYPALKMCGGSTLDLSQKTGIWDADGVEAVAGSGNPREFTEPGLVSFETNATVTVDVHGRTFEVGEKIISWPRKPEGTVFAFDEATAAAGVAPVAGETGLYYGTDGAVEKATWTGAANDGDIANPANWSCVDAAGQTVQGGLPHSQAVVRIEGEVSLQVPESTPLQCVRIEIDNCVLAADCDWRGLDFSQCSGNTIDLHGHKLYVTGLGGALTVTDTTEHYEVLEYLTVEQGAWVNTGYTPDCTVRTQIKVRLANTTGNKGIYCARTNGKRSFTLFAINNKFRFDRNSTQTSAGTQISTTADYELVANGDTLKATVNGGSIVNLGSGSFVVGSPFVLFASHSSAPGFGVDNFFVGRFYYFRVYNAPSDGATVDNGLGAGRLVREYLPVRRSSDGTVGVLEVTQHEFLQLNGTGGLTADGAVIGTRGINPGELHVTVPEGVTCENYATVLSGNLMLVKEGEGELVSCISGQLYGGGTVIACGSARSRVAVQGNLTYYEGQHFWGGDASRLVVEKGAVFDIAGHYAFRVHEIVLNGGTLANTGPDQTNLNWGGLGDITLTDDSTLDLQSTTIFHGFSYERSSGSMLDLGGHTLTMQLGRDKTFYMGAAAENGTLHVTSGGWLRTCISGELYMPTLNVRLSGGAAAWFDVRTTVNDFSMEETDLISRGAIPLNVFGQCQPQGNGFYGCLLHDGAVLDLSRFKGEFPAHSPNVAGSDSTIYEADSTITIHLSGRSMRNGERIVAWDNPPENVTFVLDDESRFKTRCSITVADDGIYVNKGFFMYIR